MKPITSLPLAAELSVNGKVTGELDASFTVKVDNKKWKCYTVAMGHREFTCYCDKGTATFVVDVFGGRHTFELFDWEEAE